MPIVNCPVHGTCVSQDDNCPVCSGRIADDTNFALIQSVLIEIRNERARQDKKWGQQNHEPEMWLSILGEEFGEVCKAVCEARFSGYASTGDWSQYRKELIQVAAVACAMVECFDRNRSWKDCPASVEITRPAKRVFSRSRKCTCVGMTEACLIAEGTPLEFYGCKVCGGRIEGVV